MAYTHKKLWLTIEYLPSLLSHIIRHLQSLQKAILYGKRGAEDWHFLCHLDPLFVEIEDVEEYVKEAMEDIQ